MTDEEQFIIDDQDVRQPVRYVVVPRWWWLRALWRWIRRKPPISFLATHQEDPARNGPWVVTVGGWRRPK